MKGDSQTSKRGLEGNSSEEDNRVVRKKIVREEYKVILKFGKENEHIHLSPIALSRELKKKLGEVDTAKILRDGNLLVICKTEEQKNKALKIDNVCKKKREWKEDGGWDTNETGSDNRHSNRRRSRKTQTKYFWRWSEKNKKVAKNNEWGKGW